MASPFGRAIGGAGCACGALVGGQMAIGVFFGREEMTGCAERRGPRGIKDYYLFFTGLDHAPQNWREWLAIPEFQLAAATNGQIFEDNANIFGEWRAKLLAFFPEDVRLKKLAARCMKTALAMKRIAGSGRMDRSSSHELRSQSFAQWIF